MVFTNPILGVAPLQNLAVKIEQMHKMRLMLPNHFLGSAHVQLGQMLGKASDDELAAS